MRTSVFFLSLAAAASAQAPAPPSPPETGMVLHFDVNLVQVDVVVTDSKGGRGNRGEAGETGKPGTGRFRTLNPGRIRRPAAWRRPPISLEARSLRRHTPPQSPFPG